MDDIISALLSELVSLVALDAFVFVIAAFAFLGVFGLVDYLLRRS